MSDVITIKKSNLQKAFTKGSEDVKKVLKNLFGEDIAPKNILERVNTMDDVYREAGTKEEDIIPYKNPKNGRQIFLNACAKLDLLREVLNEGWEADWDNSNEPKYAPYFRKDSGSRFACGDCVIGYTHTFVGSRLCYQTKEKTIHAGTKFVDVYNDFLMYKINK